MERIKTHEFNNSHTHIRKYFAVECVIRSITDRLALDRVLRGSVELPLAGVQVFPMRTKIYLFMGLNSVRARRRGPLPRRRLAQEAATVRPAAPRSYRVQAHKQTCVCPHGEEVHARKWKLYAATQDSPLGVIIPSRCNCCL
jgi:hypothetical protein